MAQEKGKVISVEQYRQMIAKPVEVTLPSGAVFTVRRLSPMDYIREGLADIPNEFLQFIAELKVGITDNKKSLEEQKKNYELFERFIQITLSKGVIEPLVVFKYDPEKVDTHLVFTELTVDDQKALIDAITGK